MNNNTTDNIPPEPAGWQAVPFLPEDDLPLNFQQEHTDDEVITIYQDEVDSTVKIGDLQLIKQALYLELDIVNTFQATGQGWQMRINEVLRKAITQGML